MEKSSRPLVFRQVLPLVLAALAHPLPAQQPPAGSGDVDVEVGVEVERTIHVPAGWEGAYEFGYAPAVRVGPWVIVSGIPAGGPGTYEEKVRRMYQRAKELLEDAGATLDDVVELMTFHVEPRDSPALQEEFQRYMPIHRELFGEHRPAWTAIGGATLLAPTAVVEMRVVAVVGSGENSRVVRSGQ